METINTTKVSEGLNFVQAMKKVVSHERIKCPPYDVCMKLELLSILPHNSTISITTKLDLNKVINISNEYISNVEDEGADLEPAIDLELLENTNSSETEAYTKIEADTKFSK